MTPSEHMNVVLNLARSVDTCNILVRELLTLYSERATLVNTLASVRKQSIENLHRQHSAQIVAAALESQLDEVADKAFSGREAIVLLDAIRGAIGHIAPLLAEVIPRHTDPGDLLDSLCALAGVPAPTRPLPDPVTESPTDVGASPRPLEVSVNLSDLSPGEINVSLTGSRP